MPGVPGPVTGDLRAPRVSGLRATVRRSGLVLRLRLDERATVTARVPRGRRVVARRTWKVAQAGAVTLRHARRLPGRGALRLELRIVDAAGNAGHPHAPPPRPLTAAIRRSRAASFPPSSRPPVP